MSPKWRAITLRLILLTTLIGILVLPFLTASMVFNQIYLRHRTAYRKWLKRQPDHYQYVLTVHKFMLAYQWHVEVRQGQVVHFDKINLPNEGSNSVWTDAITLSPLQISPNKNMIEEIFQGISDGYVLARSPSEFMARFNPEFYQNHLSDFWLPGGWEHCNPAFPQVSYHPIYSYPIETILHGKPCVDSINLSSGIRIEIEAFQPLSDLP